ncbi:MAG: type II toxin-antitoxin system RelE/ParE family toxin [Magnetococcales bacterium]|nr:type II toxin-antitoxin system RelE/ParE family toxin [Magnetococcales bacterium]
MEYDIEEYLTANGKSPFSDWLCALKDVIAQAKLTARVDRAAHGNFGDWRPLADAKGVFEMREDYGPGYRIFYSVIGRKIILLLAGSTKKNQNRTIEKAKDCLADYERRAGQ